MSGALQDRVALVTGASRGIGAALARGLAAAGAECWLLGRASREQDEVLSAIAAAGGRARLLAADLRSAADIDRACAQLRQQRPRLDLLVASAGLGGTRTGLHRYDRGEWQALFDLNLHANFLLLQGLHDALVDGARAVFLTSAAATRLPAGAGAYAVSKAALEAMVRLYAGEVDPSRCVVSILNPGPTRTAMRAAAFPGEDPATVKPAESLVPLVVALATGMPEVHGQVVDADAWLRGQGR